MVRVRAREVLAERLLGPLGLALAGLRGEDEDALAEAQRLFDRVGDTLARGVVLLAGRLVRELGDDEAVDDHVDVVPLVAVEVELLVDVADGAVDADAHEAEALDGLEDLLVLASAVADDGREQHRARPRRLGEHGVDDLLHGLAADDLPAVQAVRDAGAGVEQAQVVVDLGHRGDGGARVLRDALLVDRDGGGEAVDVIDVGLLHEAEELARVRGERLHITSLALGVDGVEGERGLAGAAQPRDDDEAVARNLDRDVLEVVLASAGDGDTVGGQGITSIAARGSPGGSSARAGSSVAGAGAGLPVASEPGSQLGRMSGTTSDSRAMISGVRALLRAWFRLRRPLVASSLRRTTPSRGVVDRL